MMLEIERKFLVDNITNCLRVANASYSIIQGYLSNDPARTVRLRIRNKRAFLTVKGASSADGTTRVEWEKEISIEEAEVLLPLCLPETIQKTRYHVPYKKHLFEVDVFEKDLEGLVIAEIELKKVNQEIELPDWIGKEVTGDKRYYNSYLATHGIPS